MEISPAVKAEWMVPERSGRLERLRAFYRDRGVPAGSIASLAEIHADDALANLCGDCRPVFECLGRGERMEDLAARIGTSKRRVYAYLMEHAPGEWARYSAAGAIERLERADAALEDAAEQVEVSRLSAISRNAQWQLERMAPRLYAAKGESGGVTINVVLDPSCGGVVFDQSKVSGAEASVEGRAD